MTPQGAKLHAILQPWALIVYHIDLLIFYLKLIQCMFIEVDIKVSPAEFQQNIGRYHGAALQAPDIITKHNRPHTVLTSAALFDVFTKGRVARRVIILGFPVAVASKMRPRLCWTILGTMPKNRQ